MKKLTLILLTITLMFWGHSVHAQNSTTFVAQFPAPNANVFDINVQDGITFTVTSYGAGDSCVGDEGKFALAAGGNETVFCNASGEWTHTSGLWRRDVTNGETYLRNLADQIGIGTENPDYGFHIANNVVFAAEGEIGFGEVHTASASFNYNGLLFLPRYVALRSGGSGGGPAWAASQIGDYSTAFGLSNQADGNQASVLGGNVSFASGANSVVGAGTANQANGGNAGILSGTTNQANGDRSSVVGGNTNTAGGTNAFIGGGLNNSTITNNSAVVGGNGNTAGGGIFVNAFVGGGTNNTASNLNSTVVGGNGNNATGSGSFVGGGISNTAGGITASVLGGNGNSATGTDSVAIGGLTNSTAGARSIVGGNGNVMDATADDSVLFGTGGTLADANVFKIAGLSFAMGQGADPVGNGVVADIDGDTLIGGNLTVADGIRVQAMADFPLPMPGDDPVYYRPMDGTLFYDLAEYYWTEEEVEATDLLCIGDTTDDQTGEILLTKCTRPYDKRVLGIASGAPAIAFKGSELYIAPPPVFDKGTHVPVALAGRVPVKASTENGAIERGDLLTSSSTPGHVMKATDQGLSFGTVVGKALDDFYYGDDGSTTGYVVMAVYPH